MAIHSHFTRFLAVVGALTLGGAAAAWAQQPTNAPKDTSSTARSDTSGYGGYQDRTDTAQAGKSDSSGFKYNGPSTDTTIKAKSGVQTRPPAGDSGTTAGKMSAATADTGDAHGADSAAAGKSDTSSSGYQSP